jgi:hypothetical protein
MVAAFETYPERLRGRNVFVFTDNTVAFNVACKGYSRNPVLTLVAERLDEVCMDLQVAAFYEWLGSDLNIGDAFTRTELRGLAENTIRAAGFGRGEHRQSAPTTRTLRDRAREAGISPMEAGGAFTELVREADLFALRASGSASKKNRRRLRRRLKRATGCGASNEAQP